jgi:hypothetical protein
MANNDFLTRDKAVQAIREGGSVLIGNTLYTFEKDLPGEAEFAVGNPDLAAAAKSSLQYQMAEIQRQLQLLEEAGTASGRSVDVDAETAAKLATTPKPAGTTAEEASSLTKKVSEQRENAPSSAYGKSKTEEKK